MKDQLQNKMKLFHMNLSINLRSIKEINFSHIEFNKFQEYLNFYSLCKELKDILKKNYLS